jgi:hypothetical protein
MQVILSGWNNFRSVVTGFEVLDVRPEPVIEPVIEPKIENTDGDGKGEKRINDGKKDQT